MITESATPPASGDPGWNSLPPSIYTFTSTGEKTLYAWAKDAAHNVSSGVSATVSISVSVEGQGPDLTIWVGKWLKISERNTGYQFAPSLFSKDNSVYTGYLKFWEWDPANKLLKGDRYEQDSQSDQWFTEPFSLRYITGSDTDFLCWAQSNGSLAMGFTARVQGKKKEGTLESGSMKTLGGYYMETSSGANSTSDSTANDQQYWAGGLSISGTLVPEPKVPVPSEALIH